MMWCVTPLPALLKASEVGALLNVSADTVLRWTREGDLPSITLPSGHKRFRRTDVEALLDDKPVSA